MELGNNGQLAIDNWQRLLKFEPPACFQQAIIKLLIVDCLLLIAN